MRRSLAVAHAPGPARRSSRRPNPEVARRAEAVPCQAESVPYRAEVRRGRDRSPRAEAVPCRAEAVRGAEDRSRRRAEAVPCRAAEDRSPRRAEAVPCRAVVRRGRAAVVQSQAVVQSRAVAILCSSENSFWEPSGNPCPFSGPALKEAAAFRRSCAAKGNAARYGSQRQRDLARHAAPPSAPLRRAKGGDLRSEKLFLPAGEGPG